jgi:hypothetical protein
MLVITRVVVGSARGGSTAELIAACARTSSQSRRFVPTSLACRAPWGKSLIITTATSRSRGKSTVLVRTDGIDHGIDVIAALLVLNRASALAAASVAQAHLVYRADIICTVIIIVSIIIITALVLILPPCIPPTRIAPFVLAGLHTTILLLALGNTATGGGVVIVFLLTSPIHVITILLVSFAAACSHQSSLFLG